MPLHCAFGGHWLTQAWRRAEVGLGVLYLEGRGVPPDDAEAARWFQRAADRGHPDAQFRLGFLHFSGRGVARDMAAAQRWYRMAADQGHAESSFYLGVMYAQGQGVGHDDVLAYALFERAVQNATGSLRSLAERRRNAMGRRMSANQIDRATELAAALAAAGAGCAAFLCGWPDGVCGRRLRDGSRQLAANGGGGGMGRRSRGSVCSTTTGSEWRRAKTMRRCGLAGRQRRASQSLSTIWACCCLRATVLRPISKRRSNGSCGRGDQGHAEANYYLGTVFARWGGRDRAG